MRYCRAAAVVLIALSINCTGRQIVDSQGVIDKIKTIIEADVDTIKDISKRERIKTSMQVAIYKIKGLRGNISRLQSKLENAREQILRSANDAGAWRGLSYLVWFIIAGIVIWVGWRMSKFFNL